MCSHNCEVGGVGRYEGRGQACLPGKGRLDFMSIGDGEGDDDDEAFELHFDELPFFGQGTARSQMG